MLRPTNNDEPPVQTTVTTEGIQPLSGLPNLPQPRPGPLPQHIVAGLQQADQNSAILHNRMQALQTDYQRLQQEIAVVDQRYRAAMASVGQQVGGSPLPRFAQTHIPMPSAVQALLAQQQRERASQGRQGVQDLNGHHTPVGLGPPSGRSSPAHGHTATYVQQGTGPNGETWRTTTTVNETRTTISSPVAVRPAMAPVNDTNGVPYNPVPELIAHMQANARAAPRPPGHASINVPGAAPSANIGNSPPSFGYPAPRPYTPSAGQSSFVSQATARPSLSAPTTASDPNSPTVYILSSPSGPRALLITGQDTHFTRPIAHAHGPIMPRFPSTLPELRRRAARGERQRVVPEGGAPPAVLGGHGNVNPPAGALAARLPNIIWLIVRLVGFVYFFTNGNASWGRWLFMTGISFIVLLANLGLFNGLINGLWAPIRAHVENIIPLAGPDAALIPAANAAAIANPQPGVVAAAGLPPVQAGPHGELDPQQVANRIIAQRRQQEMQGQGLRARMRRAEHSLLLFMASLVPGVGERHIAAREAEANERQRLIDAAAAAAAIADAAASLEGIGEGATQSNGGTGGDRNTEAGSDGSDAHDLERVPAPEGQAV